LGQQFRLLAGQKGKVAFEEIVQKHDDRPRIGDDVVQAEQRDVGIVLGAKEFQAHHRPVFQVEGPVGVLDQQELDLVVRQIADIVFPEVYPAAFAQALDGLAAGIGKDHVQHGVSLEQRGKCSVHVFDADERPHPSAEGEVIRRAVRVETIQVPERLLSFGKREVDLLRDDLTQGQQPADGRLHRSGFLIPAQRLRQ